MQKILKSMRDIQGYVLVAQDGEIGLCTDFLFDDKYWAIRYVIVNTQTWLPDRKVLVSPISIVSADKITRTLNVSLTKDQIIESPSLNANAPVSRQYEIAFNTYFDWEHYWVGGGVWGSHNYPHFLYQDKKKRKIPEVTEDGPNLRSTMEVWGYHIQATDKEIGFIEDFILDVDSWIIDYLVIDTSNWLPDSKRSVFSPEWINLVNWGQREVFVDLTSEQIKYNREFDPVKLG